MPEGMGFTLLFGKEKQINHKIVKEMQNLVDAGWAAEGMGWTGAQSGEEVYRVYNPNSGEHHFTRDADERMALMEAGWQNEGIGFYSDPPAAGSGLSSVQSECSRCRKSYVYNIQK